MMSEKMVSANKRQLGQFWVEPLGLGCMNLSHAYGTPPDKQLAERLLLGALDQGVEHFDTAALYGFGANEELVGKVLSSQRERIHLASKCGMTGVNGQRVIDGRPATLKKTCEAALRRLKTDRIDLYYLHRWDKQVPIEESVGALSELVKEGKIIDIGLSEVSAATLQKAHAVHPIAAVQTEYSLWTRNPEIAVLDACRELGVAFVAFSPLGRGFLSGKFASLNDLESLESKDIRLKMPRFQSENFQQNLTWLQEFVALAKEWHSTPSQIALAWLLKKQDNIIPIPGTTRLVHLQENLASKQLELSQEQSEQLERLISPSAVIGPRYAKATQDEIDTEEF